MQRRRTHCNFLIRMICLYQYIMKGCTIMLFCHQCGSQNTENSRFCSQCGCSLKSSPPTGSCDFPSDAPDFPADDLFLKHFDPATNEPALDFPGASTDSFRIPSVPMPGFAPEQPSAPSSDGKFFPGTDYQASVSSGQDRCDIPGLPLLQPTLESDPQPKKATPWKSLLPLLLLALLTVGFFAVDWIADREMNLFGMFHQEAGNDPAITDIAATTAPEETTLSAPTEPVTTDTETELTETVPEGTLPAVTDLLQAALPVHGKIVRNYFMDRLLYNPSTADWRTHDGLDIAAAAGTPVHAAADGTVSLVYLDEVMGNTVVIDHPNGFRTIYSSLAEDIIVHQTDAVQKEQIIGFVGRSSLVESAIGYHVHFSIQQNEQSVDPNAFLTTIDFLRSEDVLTDVMDGKIQLLTDRQTVMYLQEYMTVLQVNKIAWWKFVDFDQDGQPEVYAVTDSPDYSYLVLHWNGTHVCIFPFGARSMQTLKTNGWFSASGSAYETYYLRITFHDNTFQKHTLAFFDTSIPVYQVDGETVSKEKADQFLDQWNALPDVTRPGPATPEETDPFARCAYCGVLFPLSQMKDGLCPKCQGKVFQCLSCGKWSADISEGYCEECYLAQLAACPCCGAYLYSWEYGNAYGMCNSCLQNGGKCTQCGKLTGYLDSGLCTSCRKPVNTAACAYCGTETDVDWLHQSLCEECYYWRGVGWCDVCGKLSDNLFEGVCEDCEPWGGRGEPEECCAYCGSPSYDMMDGLCMDCYWNVSRCSVCGELSDTVFEGICDNCGGYDGRG